MVRGWLAQHPRRDDAQLAVSEVVTNALLHTSATEVEILVTKGAEGSVRVSIRYVGDPFSAVPQRDPQAVTGRGLLVVQAVTDRWGVVAGSDPGDAARVDVWFEVGA